MNIKSVVLYIYVIFILFGCRTQKKVSQTHFSTTTDSVGTQKTVSHSEVEKSKEKEFVFIHDSIFVEKRSDTVFLNVFRTIFKENLKTDTVFIKDTAITNNYEFHNKTDSTNYTKIVETQTKSNRKSYWYVWLVVGIITGCVVIIGLRLLFKWLKSKIKLFL